MLCNTDSLLSNTDSIPYRFSHDSDGFRFAADLPPPCRGCQCVRPWWPGKDVGLPAPSYRIGESHNIS